MTRHARWAVSLAVATAVGEAALQAFMVTDWSDGRRVALLFAFLVAPPLFLAMLAWRRREHPGRSRFLFGVAVLVAVGGLGALGYNLYRFKTDPQFRQAPGLSAVLVPLVQQAVILAVWAGLVAVEGREKPATGQAAQPAQPEGGPAATKPPQSP